MGSLQQSDVRAPLIDHPDRDRVAVRARCRIFDCGAPASWWAGSKPCCDQHREYLLHNNWPHGMRRMGVAS